jgi:hypothetical protein
MKRNRAFAGLPVAAPYLALEVSRRVLRSVPFALELIHGKANRSTGKINGLKHWAKNAGLCATSA